MKRQNIRNIVQLIFLALTSIGFFISFQWTMAVIMLLIVIGGSIYCGWVCPFGTLQEFATKLGGLLGIKKKKMPKAVHNIAKHFRYVVLVLVSLISASIILDIMSYEPRNTFISLLTGNFPAILGFVSIIGFTLLSMIYERFYCKYLCYEGAKYGLFSLLRPVTIHKSEETCISCGKCDRSCPMDIQVSQFNVLRSPNCITCLECVDACPIDNTLTYGYKKRGVFNKTYAAILLTVLIGGFGFLGYNVLNVDQTTDVNQAIANDIKNELNENTLYTDGTYAGTGTGFRGPIDVAVMVQNDEIISIEVTDHNDDRKWYNRAVDIIDDIINTQSTEVDLVTGATYSSRGIRDAVIEALDQAAIEGTDLPIVADSVSKDTSQVDQVDEQSPEESKRGNQKHNGNGAGSNETSTEVETKTSTEVETETSTEVETETSTEVETKTSTEVETETSTEVETKTSTEVETKTSTEVETKTSTEVETETSTEVETETSTESEANQQVYTDGTYSGVARGFRGDIYVSVTVEADEIIDITVTDHNDDRKWYNRAVDIIDDMLNKQSTDVDLISGATYSSKGIRDAVINALEKAK